MSVNTDTKARSNQYTILIVDDNPANLGLLTDYLRGHHFRILVARNGQSALSKLEYVKPDIILLDVMMPDIDGFETCRRLKADPTTKDIPVIFMTALSESSDKVKAFKLGASDYVTKPLQYEEVLARVNLHLSLRELHQNLQDQNERLRCLNTKLLETTNELGQYVQAVNSLDLLLTNVVELIQQKFDYDFVGIWLLDDNQENIQLHTRKIARNSNQFEPLTTKIPLNDTENGIIKAYHTDKAHLTAKTDTTPSEITLPMRVGKKVIGVFDIKSNDIPTFDLQDETALQMLTNQISVIIRNTQLSEAREQEAQRLAKLNADKNRFFSIISHDLRAPFQAVVGYTNLLQMKIESGATKKDVQTLGLKLHRSVKSTYHLLENLLQWSRLQRGRMQYEPEELELASLVENTLRLLGELAEHKSITLKADVSENSLVYADHNMIDTVIRNLTSNAIKFTTEGGSVQVTTTQNGNFIEVTVSDTGVGIEPDNIAKLFRMDTQVSTPGTADEEGTGLGLILCKEMVEINGGEIWIESELGVGTVVNFTVPIEKIENVNL